MGGKKLAEKQPLQVPLAGGLSINASKYRLSAMAFQPSGTLYISTLALQAESACPHLAYAA